MSIRNQFWCERFQARVLGRRSTLPGFHMKPGQCVAAPDREVNQLVEFRIRSYFFTRAALLSKAAFFGGFLYKNPENLSTYSKGLFYMPAGNGQKPPFTKERSQLLEWRSSRIEMQGQSVETGCG